MDEGIVQDTQKQRSNSLFSGLNVIIAIVILFIGILIGAFLAPRFSSLPTFLGGFPENTSVPAGNRHIALKAGNVVMKANEVKSTSLYLENESPAENETGLCRITARMKYSSSVRLGNLVRPEALPQGFDSFDIQNDEVSHQLEVVIKSKDCSVKMTPDVMELLTFDVQTSTDVQPGYYAFDILDDGGSTSSQIVDAATTDVIMLNDSTVSGVYVTNDEQQTLSSVAPQNIDGARGGVVKVVGTNVYSLYYVQGAESNIGGSKAYYFQNVAPGFDSSEGLLAGGMASGQYYVCAHSLFGIVGENVCSSTPLLTIE